MITVTSSTPNQQSGPEPSRLRISLLVLWLIAAFGGVYFARSMSWVIAGWPFNYWYASQGAVLLFIGIIALYAWWRNKTSHDVSVHTWETVAYSAYKMRLHRIMGIYILGVLAFLGIMFAAERAGLPRYWLGGIFLAATIGLYACIGIYSRTAEPSEYYVAGRRIPSMYNGMATAADWMSAASFISLAGGLYLQGFSGTPSQPGGLAYLLGWTGGFCLIGLLVAPHLRRVEVDTIPDYFQLRFGGKWPRIVLLYLRSGANLWGRVDHVSLNRCAVRNWYLAWFGRCVGLFVLGRHACGDVDTGRAVCHYHSGIFDTSFLVGLQATR
jgi:cation/acetate symporter